MKVWELKDAFGLGNLVLGERPDPLPGHGEVKLRMRAASLNFRDLVVIKGEYGRHIETPLIPLSDGVGEITAVGEGVTRFKPGDRVATMFFQGWAGGAPAAGKMAPTTLGGPLDGTLAEAMVLKVEGVAAVPEHMTDEEGATLPCAGLTAWSALVTEGGVGPGDRVLIQGTGGVSVFALHFAGMLGAETIVTSSSDAKLDRVREMGADHTINYSTEPDWDKAVKDLTGGIGVDHVVEVGGAKTLDKSLRAVRAGGTVSLIGVLSGPIAEFTLPLAVMRQVRMQGVTVGSRESFEAMARAMEKHRSRPVVDRVFAFDEAPEALDHLAGGGHLGKVCIRF